MIQIGRPYIEQAGKNFRLTADVVMDQETKKWWFEVPAEYKQYLCTERSDAFLIGILHSQCASAKIYRWMPRLQRSFYLI